MKIYQIGQLPEEMYPKVGGKASGLDLLVKHRFSVPKGFVICDTDSIDDEAVLEAFDAMGVNLVSVRSSASNEDDASASNAGQYETYLFVPRAQLTDSIRKCIASLDAKRVNDYNRHFDIDKGDMNVVVQEMIDSDKAGVLFTASPTNGACILIEAVRG